MHHFVFKNIEQVFIKFTHSFVAIEVLTFCKTITYQDFIHRFRAGRSTGTATLEAKLLQQLAALREEFLYVIFLDLHKVYDALYRSRCLEILEGYGMGP